MKIAALLTGALATVCCIQPSVADSEQSISCPYVETKKLSFSNWESDDTLELRLLGEDCTKSVVVILLRNERGYPIFWDAWPLWNLAVHRLSEEGEVERTFKQLQELSIISTKDIPEVDSDCFKDRYCYLGPYTTPKKYSEIKQQNLPALCIPVHYENIRCYFYDSEQRLTSFFYGMGV